ncbi:MAG: hypothetical protein WBY94_07920 [Polyangiaceae bacterium]
MELTGIETAEDSAESPEKKASLSPLPPKRVCETSDSLEATILSKIADAALAGKDVVVEALSRKLDAHRSGRAVGNVVQLNPRR